MKSGLLVFLLAWTAVVGLTSLSVAQTNYFFRPPTLLDPPPPAGPDGNWFAELDGDPDTSGGTNWYEPNLQSNFIPAYNFGNGERAFIENGGTAVVNTVGAFSPGQIVLGSAAATSGTLEIQSGGVLASRIGISVNGNITVGSAGGIGTLRVLPGGTLTAEGSLVEGTNSANLIRVGALAGATATLSAASANLSSKVQVFPNAAFSTTGSGNFSTGTVYTSEVTANGTNGKIDFGATATLGGSLVLNFNSYTPSVGHNWNVLEAAAFSGSFGSITSNASLASNHALVATKPAVGGGQLGYNVSVQEVLVLEVNRDTGAATLKHPGSASILLDGYFIGSDAGSLKPASWNSWDAGNLFGGDWIATAATANNLGELKPTNDATLAGGNTLNYQFGAVYDPFAGPFGTVNEDLEFAYRRSSDGAQFPGKVQYSGTKFNTLLLQVDPTGSGSAFLRNTSDTTVQIDSYDVLSAAGRLSTTGWNSLDEQNAEGANTWLEVASNTNQIGEVNQTGFTQLDPGESLNLGPLYLGGTQDLQLSFLLMGQGTSTLGKVLYQALAAVQGDYNSNGIVDAGDYTIWRDTLGSTTDLRANGDNVGASAGKIDAADYSFWKSHFGNTSGSGSGGIGSASPVPEPASWMLVSLALGMFMVVRRGKH